MAALCKQKARTSRPLLSPRRTSRLTCRRIGSASEPNFQERRPRVQFKIKVSRARAVHCLAKRSTVCERCSAAGNVLRKWRSVLGAAARLGPAGTLGSARAPCGKCCAAQKLPTERQSTRFTVITPSQRQSRDGGGTQNFFFFSPCTLVVGFSSWRPLWVVASARVNALREIACSMHARLPYSDLLFTCSKQKLD